MPKKNYCFDVVFDRTWDPDKESKELPTVGATIGVVASDIAEAMFEAWKAVAFDPQEYEIVSVNRTGHFRYRNKF